MPIALDPAETFELSTARDRARHPDPATRPTFIFHYLTGGEFRAHLALAERQRKFFASPDASRDYNALEAMRQEMYQTLGAQIVGWRNLRTRKGEPIPFDAGKVQWVMGDAEAVELFESACQMSDVGVAEKNACGSPSLSPSAEPAEAVVPAASAADAPPK